MALEILAGLKLDDIRNEWHPDVQTAISRLTPEELSNRNKRLKRAMDLSLKHSELNKEAQIAVQPLVGYLPLERAREERLERFLLCSCSRLHMRPLPFVCMSGSIGGTSSCLIIRRQNLDGLDAI